MTSPSTSTHLSSFLDSTSSRPPTGQHHPDPTANTPATTHGSTDGPQDRFSSSDPSSTTELAGGPLNTQSNLARKHNPSQTSSRLPTKQSLTNPTSLDEKKALLISGIDHYPDFPQQGILFYDILPLFRSPSLFTNLLSALEDVLTSKIPPGGPSTHGLPNIKPDIIVGLEARGFLFGPALALRLGCGFVPVRKPGKLPGKLEKGGYTKEYGSDEFEVQASSIEKGARVLVVDDVIATGGSAAACGELVRKLGGDLIGYLFFLELKFLKGRDKLDAPVHALLTDKDMKKQT